jgi:hypothetical protein
MRKSILILACMLSTTVATTNLYGAERASLLVAAAQRLHCASSEAQAVDILDELEQTKLASFGLPFDEVNGKDSGTLYIASLDILLRALDETVTNYPGLEQKVGKILLGWNFCALRQERLFLDLKLVDGELNRIAPSNVYPASQIGLSRWGLLSPDPDKFNMPLKEQFSDKSLWLTLHNQQCFPSPASGEMPDEEAASTLSGSLRLATLPPSEHKYPFKWRPACEVQLGELDGYNQGYESGVASGFGKKNIELAAKGILKRVDQSERDLIISKSWSKEAYEAGISSKREAGFKLGREAGLHAREALALEQTLPSAGSNPVVSVRPQQSGYGFAGSYYHTWSVKDWSPSLSGSVSWTPSQYWFVRAAGNLKYSNHDKDLLTYSWGIGYDDWHPGTFGVQLNNWGPINWGDGFDIEKAIGAITYKIDSKFLQSKKIGSSIALSVPINNGNPALQTNFRWSPIPSWYIYSGFSFPLDGKTPTWNYGFGRQDYRPFTFTFQYNNYGPNTILKDNFNQNGTLTIGGSWAF